MTALLIALTLMAPGPDTLSKVTLERLAFKAPTRWVASSDDASSKTFTADGDLAQFAVSAYPVDPVRPAATCVDEMLEKLGRDGFKPLKLGGQPAQKKIDTDYVGDADAEKSDANKVTTTTVVGCDGRTRWVMTWTSRTSKGARFGPMLKRVLDSISYGK